MKAVLLEKLNNPLSIKDIDLTELKIGQVLVRNLVSGLCGAQLHEIKGFKGNEKFLPHLMGHEGCGIIEDIGKGVSTVKKGDKVVMHWRVGDGIEAAFPSYIYDGKIISSGKVTTLSEYSIVSENRVTSVPFETSSSLCAILGCSLTTALGVIDNEISLKFGESIAIIGCGGVGLNLIQGASMKSAYPVVAIDNNKNKKDLCLKCGANIFLEDIEQYDNGEFDIIIDTTGVPSVISNAISKLSGNGRLLLVGQPAPGKAIEIMNAVNMFGGSGKTIFATQGGKTAPQRDIPKYIKLFNAGMLDIDNLITNYFSLDRVNDAFDLLRSGDAGRIMIKIAKEE